MKRDFQNRLEMVTKDAEGLKKKPVADEFSPIKYDSEKSAELLEDDKKIGAKKLGIKAELVKITPVERGLRQMSV